MLILALFAAIASFLAAVGLYGVVSYTVSRRTREVGLRVAMGAPPSSLMREIHAKGMKPAVAGVVIGLAAALPLARLLETLLFGVTPFDPVSYGITAIALLAVAAIACFVPAREGVAAGSARSPPARMISHQKRMRTPPRIVPWSVDASVLSLK